MNWQLCSRVGSNVVRCAKLKYGSAFVHEGGAAAVHARLRCRSAEPVDAGQCILEQAEPLVSHRLLVRNPLLLLLPCTTPIFQRHHFQLPQST